MILNSHIFNQASNRLEPIDCTCKYCGDRQSEDMRHNYFIPLYQEGDRTNLGVYKSVKYQTIKVGVSRCHRCMKIHRWATLTRVLVLCALSFTLPWLLMGIPTSTIDCIIFSIPAIMVLVFGKYVVYPLVETQIVRVNKIRTKQDGAIQYDIVKDLLQQGWTFDEPKA